MRVAKSGVRRRVIEKREESQTITLVMLVGGHRRLWCGYRENVAEQIAPVYCIGDKKMFEVYRHQAMNRSPFTTITNVEYYESLKQEAQDEGAASWTISRCTVQQY